MADKIVNASQKKTPAAKVNGTVISISKVEAGLKSLLEPYKDVKGKVRLSQPEQYGARKQVIENLIMRELLYQEGCKKGITADHDEIQRAVELSASEYGTEQEFRAMLLATRSSPDEFRDQLKKDIVVNKLAASIVKGKKKSITEKEARKYYDEHLPEMKGPAARKILHIMAPLDRYAAPEEEKKTRKLLEKVSSVKEFEKRLVDSSKKESAIIAEDLGFVRRGRIHPLLDPIAFRLEPGKISWIVRTEEGLHLLLVKALIEDGDLIPFDLIKDEIKTKLYEIRSVAMINKFSEELRKKADIEILDRIADSKLEQERQ